MTVVVTIVISNKTNKFFKKGTLTKGLPLEIVDFIDLMAFINH